jgi:hypothetical protein
MVVMPSSSSSSSAAASANKSPTNPPNTNNNTMLLYFRVVVHEGVLPGQPVRASAAATLGNRNTNSTSSDGTLQRKTATTTPAGGNREKEEEEWLVRVPDRAVVGDTFVFAVSDRDREQARIDPNHVLETAVLERRRYYDFAAGGGMGGMPYRMVQLLTSPSNMASYLVEEIFCDYRRLLCIAACFSASFVIGIVAGILHSTPPSPS